MVSTPRSVHARTILPVTACFLMLLVSVTGCATQRVEIEDKHKDATRLYVARAGTAVTLAWDSAPDRAYAVFYNQTRNGKTAWRVLPGFDRIRGTGRRIQFTDTVPLNQARYYRLHTYSAVSLGR